MTKKVTVLGAGGKMGYRVSANLRGSPYEVSHVEVSEAGRNRLKELGITCVDSAVALPAVSVSAFTTCVRRDHTSKVPAAPRTELCPC